MKTITTRLAQLSLRCETRLVAAFCMALSACACGSEAAGNDGESLAEVGQPIYVPDGFYQVANGNEVYWLSGSSICWVRDPGMLMAIRGTTTPQWTASPSYTLQDLGTGRASYVAACHYPTGKMLRTYDSPWVYMIQANSFCHVKDMAQLARFGGSSKVLVMQKSRQWADYTEGGGVAGEGQWPNSGARYYTGDCQDPGGGLLPP